MAYGEYGYDGLGSDYLASQGEIISQQVADLQTGAAAISGTGTTDGQVAVWVSGLSAYVAGSIASGDGIAISYVSSPAPGLAIAVNAPTTLRTALGLGIKAIATGTVSVDPASIAANSGGTVDVTITGLATDDTVIFNPPALTAGLLYVGCRAQSANTARLFLYNATGAPIDEASASWRYTWIDAT